MKKSINIRLKTLYDKRRTYNFKCNIESPISVLLEKLTIEEEKINANSDQTLLEKEKEKEKIEKNELNKKDKFERFDKNSQYRIISSNVNFFILILIILLF